MDERPTDPGTAPIRLDYATPGLPRSPRPARRPIVPIIVVGLLELPLIILAGYPLAFVLPFGWGAYALVEVDTHRSKQQSGGTDIFGISGFGTGRGQSTRLESADVWFDGDVGRGLFEVNLRDMTYLPMGGPKQVQSRPLTREVVLDYVAQSGFDPSTDGARGFADGILRELKRFAQGQLPPEVPQGMLRMHMPCTLYFMKGYTFGESDEANIWLPWYTPYCLPVWMAAWGLSGRWLLRRWKRSYQAGTGR